MSLALIGKGAAYEFRWRTWAMLRDVIHEHLDQASYATLCAMGDAMVYGKVAIRAARLADELARLREALHGRPFSDLVVGPRTAALLHLAPPPKDARPLTPSEIEAIRPVAGSFDLAEYFATMIDSMARVCTHPDDDGMLELVDG